MDKKPEFIICYSEPCAYQRRESLAPHAEGFSKWREIDKPEFERLNRLRAAQPMFYDHVQTRELFAQSTNPRSECA